MNIAMLLKIDLDNKKEQTVEMLNLGMPDANKEKLLAAFENMIYEQFHELLEAGVSKAMEQLENKKEKKNTGDANDTKAKSASKDGSDKPEKVV